MANLYVTGPAHIFVQLPGIAGPQAYSYLGTAERYPKISIRPANEPVFNDIGGKVPFDMAHMGEEAFVSADISRWNEPVYAALAARPRPGSGTRGVNVAGDIGTLYVTEGFAYSLAVLFPYAAKLVYAAAGMPAGYRFLSSYLVGPDELEPLGTTPRKIRLMWHCLRTYDPSTGSLFLYDHDMTGPLSTTIS